MSNVSITFTAKVERVHEHNGSYALSLKVDDGSKYGGRADLWTDTPASVGDTVEVTTERMPYGKVRTYTDREGNDKTVADLKYMDAKVRVIGGAPAPKAEESGEIPFHHLPFGRSERLHHAHWARCIA